MIAIDMPVQIRRSGTMVPVQNLMIGDLLYEPICDNYIEIIDILSQETTRPDYSLTRLKAGMFSMGSPRQDILVSRHQHVGFLDRSPAMGRPGLAFAAAFKLGDEHRGSTRLFAIFSEAPGCINVGGALLQLYEPTALTGLSTDGMSF